ncbi:MAG: citrate synthase [Fibrobacteria bacterium]|nr:citrate synthase [Fibrobacteria bacterium]
MKEGKATLEIGKKKIKLDILKGTEGELGIDISQLRAKTKLITVDEGYCNTGSCISDITFINGEKGILRHRGYGIEALAENCRFVEVAYLIIYGELPTPKQAQNFSLLLEKHSDLHSSLINHFEGFPPDAPPMAIMSAMLNATMCLHKELLNTSSKGKVFDNTAAHLISKVRTIAAWAYRKANGLTFNHPNPFLKYCENFLHMMFSMPYNEYVVHPDVEKALNLFLILHADHEQNCSTSSVRLVGSSHTYLFSSVSAGVCALWGPLHGGANTAVIKMLTDIHKTGKKLSHYIEMAKDKDNDYRLMGFGHRVYKNFDPRARILKKQVDKMFESLQIDDPLLEIAKKLEEIALTDDYFIERKLYPNIDFYSGILLRTIGIPKEMYPVLFSIGRMPGWISNWREMLMQKHPIGRPRQIYNGPAPRDFPIDKMNK